MSSLFSVASVLIIDGIAEAGIVVSTALVRSEVVAIDEATSGRQSFACWRAAHGSHATSQLKQEKESVVTWRTRSRQYSKRSQLRIDNPF